MSRSGLCIAAIAAALAAASAAAHHSYVEFDQQSTVEIEGTLLAAEWQNPHSRLSVAGADGGRRSSPRCRSGSSPGCRGGAGRS